MADLAAFEKATAEFIACPHCARKFAPTAYDCHVRICKMKPANPTKPTPVTKTNLSIVKPVEMAAYEQATSNFQVCPHCSRKFSPATFERHVVGCKLKTVQKPTRRLPSRAKVNAPAQTAAAVPPPPAPPAAPPTAAPAVTTPSPAQRRRDDAPVVAHASREVARQRAIDRALDPNANAPRHDTLSVLRELPAADAWRRDEPDEPAAPPRVAAGGYDWELDGEIYAWGRGPSRPIGGGPPRDALPPPPPRPWDAAPSAEVDSYEWGHGLEHRADLKYDPRAAPLAKRPGAAPSHEQDAWSRGERVVASLKAHASPLPRSAAEHNAQLEEDPTRTAGGDHFAWGTDELAARGTDHRTDGVYVERRDKPRPSPG